VNDYADIQEIPKMLRAEQVCKYVCQFQSWVIKNVSVMSYDLN